jgi:glutaconate CoA-transferase subunit A
MKSKLVSMKDAIAAHVRDGDTVVIEGFTHLICFAAGHEIIRQRRKDLTICRLTPDLIYDQLIGAGCAKKLVFSWAGNPGAGSLHAFRRAGRAGNSAARDRGVQPLRDGGANERRCRRVCPSGP